MNLKKIKKVLGGKYSSKIIPHLESLGINSPSGDPLTPQIIQNIVHGRTINVEIMQEIKNLVAITEKQLRKLSK